MSGDLAAGRPDEQSMEQAYAYWDRFHCPDWERRHRGDPDQD
ncbi:MAG: hypothetical protein Q8R60_02200 [Mycobacteriales bacterium]|nr:hypothetical protein [Mycobacteriales bacterium]